MSFFRPEVLLVFICCSMTFSSGTDAISLLENRLTKLESKFYQMEEKNIQLDAKNFRLEEKNIRLEEKVTELEERNAQLEIKVQEQENILISLLVPTNQSESGSKFNLNNRQSAIQLTGKMSGTPRTCRELRMTNPSLPSGMQWIDPDGQGVGDDPIYVYCDMTSGSTSISHDSKTPIDVSHYADPGCYSRLINYNASTKQMKALAELSAECHQSIKYDCFYAPFEFNNVAYAWWNDRDGNDKYFWAGSNAGGLPRKHFCQCGIDGNCVDNSLKCNCDASAPVQLADEGVITDKNVLPVTRLNFGRTQLTTSSGIHTLGRLVCAGTVALTGLPTSCEDLWLIGHTLNGVYSIKGAKMMESVYCDFTKLPEDAGFQKWIGYVDVKSAPVHFYVQRETSLIENGTVIPWEVAVVNEGNAMDLTSGIFTAPRPGIYFFAFDGVVGLPQTSSYLLDFGLGLFLNGNQIGIGYNSEGNTFANQHTHVSLQSALNLKKGDQVWVQINWMPSGAHLHDEPNHWTHFTGFMLEEEITSSL